MVKEARFEPGSSMNVLKVCWISLSSATRKDELKLVRLGIEPWLGKLILQCFEHRLGKEGLVLAAIMPNASSIFCKMGNEEDKLKFDHYKVSFEQQTCLSSLSENVAMYSGYDQLGCMENREKKTLTGFCYWGGERTVNANGTFLYNGGMCVAVLLEEGSQLNELLEKVCGALKIKLEGQMFFYNTKRDKTKYVTLNDDNGVAMLFHLNEDDVDLFVEEIRQNNDPIRNTAYNSTRESMVTDNISSPGGILALPSPSQVSNSFSQEMGLVPYLPDNAKQILTGKGQLFESPDLFKQSVLLFAASNKFSFSYLDNSRAYYRLVCKVAGCPWKLTAKCEGSSDLVRVIMFRNDHQHNAEDASNYKLTFRSKQVGLLFKNRIVDKPQYLPRDICKDFEHVFQCRLNYGQGWRAKEKAKEAITGPPSMTFHLVPWMCRRLVEAIPNTRAIWTSTDEGKFKQLFVSYGCSIGAFRSGYIRPVLKLDACFLTGYYRGHVLSASAHDVDDGLYPLAYAIVSSENDEDWLWFLVNLKEVLGGCQVVLVTDQNTSLLNGIFKVFGRDCNAWCLRHLKENFSKFASSKGLKAERRNTALKVVNDLAFARTEDSFKYHLGKLYGISPDLSKWVEDNNPKHWSNAFFPYKRWDKMYTNLVECFNSWILPLRELDIIQFMTGHVSKTTELLLRKHTEVRKWKLPVGKEIEKEIKKSQEYARKFTHRNSSPTEFIVANDTRKLYAVKLIPRHCSCLAWQMSGIPCAHAARAIQSSGFSIYDMVDPFLKKEMQMAIYDNTMSPVPLHDMPSASSFLAVNDPTDNNVNNGVSCTDPFLHPPAVKRQAGRPKKRRIESQTQDKGTVFCSRCREPGHNRSTCQSAIPG
ncbi:hypothetical protein RHMOL_Rhmol06G0199500 [Rhododendron molle]|uniref:Uncharacterized protein n=1 Tax=Rhododendron molle TaxID=49168 RepID=A0ACC0NFD9_RHOML|nr:hypothetical protein RHMOL_Rhmol06G0199500 [Rhododendron molle]